MQGSRKCRAKIITDIMVNGQTAIVSIKGNHNHPVNIKRNKPLAHQIRRRTRGDMLLSDMKVEALMDEQYQDYIIEEDDENLNV